MADKFPRQEDRTEVKWIAVVCTQDGAEIQCTIKDVSKSGMKICLPERQALPSTFMIKVIGRPLVFRVRRVWRNKHQLGAVIEAIAKVPTPPVLSSQNAECAEASDQHRRLGRRVLYGQRD